MLALSLINIALEAGGEALGASPPLVNTLQGELCKHLLHNSQTDEPTIRSLTLRVVFNLFSSIKDHLNVQLEVFLTSVHLRIVDGGSTAKGGPSAPTAGGAPAGGAGQGLSMFSPEVRFLAARSLAARSHCSARLLVSRRGSNASSRSNRERSAAPGFFEPPPSPSLRSSSAIVASSRAISGSSFARFAPRRSTALGGSGFRLAESFSEGFALARGRSTGASAFAAAGL